jgi:hypothetical protein
VEEINTGKWKPFLVLNFNLVKKYGYDKQPIYLPRKEANFLKKANTMMG